MKSSEVTTKQNEIVEMGKLIAIGKESIEETISTAMQPLKAAKERVIQLEKSDLNEMLGTETPMEAIETVGECFVILKGIRDVSWKTVRSIMSEENFFTSLMEMNCDSITSKQLTACKNYIKVSMMSFLECLAVTICFFILENGFQRTGNCFADF